MPHLDILCGLLYQLTCKSTFLEKSPVQEAMWEAVQQDVALFPPWGPTVLMTLGAKSPHDWWFHLLDSQAKGDSLYLKVPLGLSPWHGHQTLIFEKAGVSLLLGFSGQLTSEHLTNEGLRTPSWNSHSGVAELRFNNKQSGKDPKSFLAKCKWYLWYLGFTWKRGSYL